MKKTLFLAAFAAAVITLAGCQKEELVEKIQKNQSPVFTATINTSLTRTTIDTYMYSSTKGKVKWEEGDEITITDAANHTAVYTTTDGTSTFTFKSGTPLGDGPYTATYGQAPTTAQTYMAKAGKLPMTAPSTETTNLTFSVTCGLLKVCLAKSNENIKTIKVTGTPEGGSETTFTLTCTEAQSIDYEKSFYISLPAGSYNKFLFADSDGKICIKTATSGNEIVIGTNEIQQISFSTALTFDYLYFTALEADAVIKLNKFGSVTPNALMYMTMIDGALGSWTDLVYDADLPTLTNIGDKIFIKAKEVRAENTQTNTKSLYFTATGDVEVSGNIMYLTDPTGKATTVSEYEFYCLFNGCDNLINADKLVLPAATLADNCYEGMFYGCTGLTTAPSLPAETLAPLCYSQMFQGCTGLTTAPALPATALASSCYYKMFQNCTGLTTAPALPAKTLATGCYSYMFQNCTGLTTAPVLPATILANSCYSNMFQNCTGLTTAPELPARLLKDHCYQEMFYDCTNLTAITCMAKDMSAEDCTKNWVSGVISEGTFTIASTAKISDWNTKPEYCGKPVYFSYANSDQNLLAGEFSVSKEKTVKFTKSNLYWDGSAYHFETCQTDYNTSWNASHVSHFYWTSLSDYNTGNDSYMPYASGYAYYNDQSKTNSFWCDASNKITVDGTGGLYALSNTEWEYLIVERSNASSKYRCGVTIDGVANCFVIAPDDFSGTLKSSYTLAELIEADIVCLPPAGHRKGSTFYVDGTSGRYWTSKPFTIVSWAICFTFNNSSCSYAPSSDCDITGERSSGYSMRLVK